MFKFKVRSNKYEIFIVIVAAVLSFILWGCDSQDKPQYDEATNQHVSVHGISFQVPKAWEKSIDNEDCLAYSESLKEDNNKGYLTITFDDNGKLSEVGDGIIRYGLKNNHAEIKNVERSNVTIANMSAIKIEYTQKVKDINGNVKIVLLQAKNGVIMINFYSPSKMGLEDFDKVISSIKKNK